MLSLIVLGCLLATVATAKGPIVSIQQGKVQGFTSDNLTQFLGIPFAAPPVGHLRLNLPAPPLPFKRTFQALAKGAKCAQQTNTSSAAFNNILAALPAELAGFLASGEASQGQEDCLTLDIIVPPGTTASSKLPVLFWIYGGGFEQGSTQDNNGTTVVARSIQLGEPVIYVAANYRLNAFGFLGSKEIEAAGVGNLGLHDQRAALRWVNKNIAAFGGDPKKVTIWGESAGSISVALHMVTNNGNTEGLFRGAVMESGSVLSTQDLSAGQPYYDSIVKQTGCARSRDTLACLRTVPFQDLLDAVNQTPSINAFMSLQLAYQPRTDGVFIKENAQALLASGRFAKIPFINGDCDDEGTLFSLANSNLTTPNETIAYIKEFYFPKASNAQLNTLAALYPSDPAAGSPFNTGDLNALTPQFKRMAALQGDLVFQAPRRNMFNVTAGVVPHWSFLFVRGKATPFFGTFHSSDIAEFYGTPGLVTPVPDFQGTDFLLNFANNLNPNVFNKRAAAALSTTIFWPEYTTSNRTLMTFLDGAVPLALSQDNFRVAPISFLAALSKQFDP